MMKKIKRDIFCFCFKKRIMSLRSRWLWWA